MNENQIDIFIMTRDREIPLRRTLQSLASQSLNKVLMNVIIIDNNSTHDINYHIIKKEYSEYFKSLKICQASKNVAALGYCLAFSENIVKSEYTLKLDDDMVLPADYIQSLMDAFTEDCVAISGIVNFFEEPERCWSRGYHFWRLAAFSVPSNSIFRKVNDLPSCALLIRTSALLTAGGFSKDFFIYKDDTFLCYRLNKVGKLKLLKDVVCLHDVPTNRRSSDFATYNDVWSRCELCEKVSASKLLFIIITLIYFGLKIIFEIAKNGTRSALKNSVLRMKAANDHRLGRHRFYDMQLHNVHLREI